MKNKEEKMEQKNILKNYVVEYKEKLNRLIDSIDLDILHEIIETMVEAFKNNKTLYICGNGGSAATASHMQVDIGFFVRYFVEKRPKVRSLTDNTPFITAIGNDNGYDEVFVEQMKDNFVEGDVLLAISASGNSMNVVKAAEYANENGGTSIGFVGFQGGKLKDAAKLCLYTPNPKGEYGPIEDIHMILGHLIVTYFAKHKEFLKFGNPQNN